MKLSRAGLILVMVAILFFGWPAGPAEASEHACYRPEVLFSYLDIDRYNRSYPFVDYKAVICNAKDPEKEAAAWRDLAQELNHRLHTDDSVYKIVKVLFGNTMVPSMLKPPLDSLIFNEQSNDCVHQLGKIFMQHCGGLTDAFKHLDTLLAMCNKGVKEHDFLEAAYQICKDYVYLGAPWD